MTPGDNIHGLCNPTWTAFVSLLEQLLLKEVVAMNDEVPDVVTEASS